MFAKVISASVILALCSLPSVNAHGVLTAVKGANGVTAMGFGVDPSTPRDGTRRNPFQQDSSIIRDRELTSGKAGACGRTLGGGVNDVAAQMTAASDAGLPSAGADGSVTMTLHQVNGDGAGPYTCEVSADGTGQTFTAMQVTTNVPGTNSRSKAKATDFALVAKMPAGTTCTGGPNGDACIVRCRNAANAGPFGGCVAVTNSEGATGTAQTGTAGAGKAGAGTAGAGTAGTAGAETAGADTAGADTASTGAAGVETATASAGTAKASGKAAAGAATGAAGTGAATGATGAKAGAAGTTTGQTATAGKKATTGAVRRRWVRSRITGKARWI